MKDMTTTTTAIAVLVVLVGSLWFGGALLEMEGEGLGAVDVGEWVGVVVVAVDEGGGVG